VFIARVYCSLIAATRILRREMSPLWRLLMTVLLVTLSLLYVTSQLVPGLTRATSYRLPTIDQTRPQNIKMKQRLTG